jgi:hypothetical protein
MKRKQYTNIRRVSSRWEKWNTSGAYMTPENVHVVPESLHYTQRQTRRGVLPEVDSSRVNELVVVKFLLIQYRPFFTYARGVFTRYPDVRPPFRYHTVPCVKSSRVWFNKMVDSLDLPSRLTPVNVPNGKEKRQIRSKTHD